MTTPETCTCGRPMVGRRTTKLGVFSICTHCDLPCLVRGCPLCVLIKSERRG